MTWCISGKKWKRNFLTTDFSRIVLLSYRHCNPMPFEYFVTYHAENHYDTVVNNAVWQFLIVPEDNDNQDIISIDFTNSLHVPVQNSINGYGFRTLRIHPRVPFQDISFKATFKLIKGDVNPFGFMPASDPKANYSHIGETAFRTEFEPFLRHTRYTCLPDNVEGLFKFDTGLPVFDNLMALNHWVYLHLYFKPGTTDVQTTLKEVVASRQGVCQDFSHLFCALARKNGIPVRYVSGYLHQGNGYFGDSQMHAWVEAYVPEAGWLGFDPTNDILVGSNHIKVAHGKDYEDCAPLKGVIFAPGSNTTTHSVEVTSRQAQQ